MRARLFASSAFRALLTAASLAACAPRTLLGTLPGAPDASADQEPAADATADDAADDTATDAPGDVVDAPADAAGACASDADCTAAGQSCIGFRCVTATRCTSSRMCTGQVCDTARGACVDCVSTIDCPAGQVCFNNACGSAPPSCRSDRECSARMQVCNITRMTCVDCNADVDCATGRYCADGSCVPQVCAPGSTSCADETTRRVCAADGRSFAAVPCPAVANAASRCVDGACATTCAAGFADCDMVAANGCEVDLRTTPSHCGRCTTACPSAGGVASCAAGVCGLACAAGSGDCDGDAANGCETNTASSNMHCGACGRACGAGQSCTAGACATTSCPTGRTLCAGACVDLNADLAHCGACGRTCATPYATPTCSAGTCRVASCNAGFGNCNGNDADGCETNITVVLEHCGACGRVCAPANAMAACRSGACTVAACNAGYANCNGSATDGCETNTQSSAANCGSCGRVCAAGQSCTAGACVTNPCPAGQTLCGATCRNLSNDPSNCGACGRPCDAGQSCVSGACSVAPLRFTLTWNVIADLDLALVTPSGRVINYGTPMGDGGTHGGDNQGTGPETITWSSTPPSGTYSVCVIPYRISSATSYTVQVLRDGAVALTRTGTYTSNAASGAGCSRTGGYRLFDYTY